MATIADWFKIDGEHMVHSLQEASDKLDRAEGEMVLDFSSVGSIDTSALQALEELAGIANKKTVKVELRGVNVNVYKVLKLAKLGSRFSFGN